MGAGDCSGRYQTEKICKSWSGDRSVLRDVWYHDGTFNGRAGRIAWYLVVFIFCNLCDGGGMDRGSPDRTVISSAMVGLFREKRELGWLYLPECFCVLGCSGICDGDLGK